MDRLRAVNARTRLVYCTDTFFHLRRLRSVRRQLGRDVLLWCLDYCNAVLAGLQAATLAPLQTVLTGQSPDYITDLPTPVDNILTRVRHSAPPAMEISLYRVLSGEPRILCRCTSCMQSPRACNQLPTETQLKLMRSSATAFERHLKTFCSAPHTNYM